MPELRKRKASKPTADPPVKRANSFKPGVSTKVAPNGASSGRKVSTGDFINLDGFGGEFETHDGKKATLKSLVEESENGVVLFTYPKASTPGCRFFLSF